MTTKSKTKGKAIDFGSLSSGDRDGFRELPREADDCMRELRWLYDRRDLKEAQTDLTAWLKRWEARYPKLTEWVEENMGETHEIWMKDNRYLDMSFLKEQKKAELKKAA